MRSFVVHLVVLALAWTPSAVASHAFLDRAEPRADSVVNRSPAQLTLYFTERLEPAYSRARVFNGSGERVNTNDSHVDPSDGTVIRVPLPSLGTGTYRVIWRVLSIDSHVTEGQFTFRVAP